jgi:membrane-associated protease RseP (regulator of RpoE activity)
VKEERIEISAGAALAAALLVFFLRGDELLALGLPLIVHELGHLAAILVMGLRPLRFRAGLGGFRLDYAGDPGTPGHVCIAAAGPVAGLLYAWAASRLGAAGGGDWLWLSAGISLLLSLFNLLPALPLDGGQILFRVSAAALGELRGRTLCRFAQLAAAGMLTAAGALLLIRGRGAALLLSGIWLLFGGETAPGLVKSGRIR